MTSRTVVIHGYSQEENDTGLLLVPRGPYRYLRGDTHESRTNKRLESLPYYREKYEDERITKGVSK